MTSKKRDISVLLSTCPPEAAEELATFLVEGGHAACVNIVSGVRSVYRWQGAVERDEECLLVIKTPSERSADVVTTLAARHPNDVPEILVIGVDAGHVPYLDWVGEVTGRGA